MRRRSVGTAVAHGERSIAISGNVSGSIVTTGDVVLEVRDDDLGAELRRRLRSERPLKADRRPTKPPPGFAERLDRESEIAAVAVAVSKGPVNIYGPAGIGKTYVIRDAANASTPKRLADGPVFLATKVERVEDALQALFEEFYSCDPPARPSDADIRQDLERKRALIFLDSVAVERDELQALVAAAPASTFVVGSRERVLWEGHSLFVEGLDLADGQILLARELGRELEPTEREAAAAICAAVRGNPLKLRQAAALVRETGRTLDDLARALEAAPDRALLESALGSLSDEQRRLVFTLAVFNGATVGAERLAALTGAPDVQGALASVERLHLVESHSPRYSATAAVTDASWLDLEPEAGVALEHFADWASEKRPPPERLLAEGDALLQLLRWAEPLGRIKEGLRLARAWAPAFASARRFGSWGEAVGWARAWADSIGDLRAAAWALHEEGTRLFCLGRTAKSAALLEQAAQIREQIGDKPAAARSRGNLEVVRRPRPLFTRFTHLPFMTTLLFLLVLVIAGGSVGAWKLAGGSPSPNEPTAAAPGVSTVERTKRPSNTTTTGPVTVRRTLSLAVDGTGTIEVDGGKSTCPAVCSVPELDGTTVDLNVASTLGQLFTGWSGAGCTGTDACTVTMDRDQSVTATFTQTDSLTVSFRADSKPGTVSSDPAGIDCGSSCSAAFVHLSNVKLTATTDQFDVEWWCNGQTCTSASTDCRFDDRTCTLTMDGDMSVEVWFGLRLQ